uniref:Tenascin XB n=1 Tax=Sphaeramia orbicularis TaxID=375764 RepID=A0A672YSG4_9TELE
MKNNTDRVQAGGDRVDSTSERELDSKSIRTRIRDSKPLTESDVSRKPLDNVAVTNRTSDGFTVVWDAPEGKYKNFVVTGKQNRKDEDPKVKKGEEDQEEDDEGDKNEHHPTEETENIIPENGRIQSTTIKPPTESDKPIREVLPGSARFYQFENLLPKTDYTVTLLGKGPGLLSRLHKLVISTGPEPPSNIVFSQVTENSVTVSWTKPKSPVSGFKVTYTHSEDGEPVSVSLDSKDSSVSLSQLSPGSSYEVSILSILGLDESDPIKDLVMTLPDPPTDLRAINVSDTKALLLWRPALATVDKYAIVYGSGTGENPTSVSHFYISRGSRTHLDCGGREGPRDLQATNVTPRTALLSWKPPSTPFRSYRLTYQTEGEEVKEVSVDSTVTEFSLSRLHPGSVYRVQLEVVGGGRSREPVSTEFTTGTLRFPFPSDCSQELLNGIRTSGVVDIFPQGKRGGVMTVYCDMDTDGGGWTVFQRRKDGSVDFFRGWNDYVRGFGDPSGEFWLGLDGLHNLTRMTPMTLRVDLRDGDDAAFAKYSTFEVAKRNYRLTVGGYSGTAGDSLSYHNNRIFTTKDRDPASFITRCAMSYRGGWWYKNCHEANLNGLYGIDLKHQGLIWTSWKGKEVSVQFTEMKMRPTAFRLG